MVNKPYVKDIFAFAPRAASTLDDHPLMAAIISADFIPDDELSRIDLGLWRSAEFPGTNGHVSALGMATFYSAMAQEKLLSREHMEEVRVSQGGFDTDVCLGARVADH